MEPKKTKGSFGMPDDVLKAVNESKAKARGEESKKQSYADSESIPEETPEATPEATPEVAASTSQKEKTDDEVAEEIRKDLGIEITEDDMWQFLFKGQLTKPGVEIVPGKMVATFKTINMNQTQAIDERLADILEKKLLDAGFRNLQTRHVLSEGIASLNKPSSPEKPLGKNSSEVFTALGNLPTLLVEKISQKWNRFVWLVNYEVNKNMEGPDGKNS